MELVGVALGVAVAILWGTADSIATLAARRLGTLRTTFLSQAAGLLALILFEALSSWLWSSFTPAALLTSALMGAGTGVCAAVGYAAFYRALELGPIALVSPLSSTSAIVTLSLAVFLLQEQVTLPLGLAVAVVVLGVLLASTDLHELHLLLEKKPRRVLASRGVRWAIVATVAFGAMDFGIGASARAVGWFLPVLWTRTYSLLFLTLILTWRSRRARPRMRYDSVWLWRRHLQRGKGQQGDTASFAVQVSRVGFVLALVAGVLENAAVLTFSADTQIAMTGVAAALASNYSVVTMLFGFTFFRERLSARQLLGIGLVLCGLLLVLATGSA